ncbi:MAG: septal ring lytic transglycosylase RlpA family protein [Sphingobacteriia bacterium]|nr:septal ring lytic transglycosylase RlpA family protein [Sphingobacteriia bacterium]
MPNNQLKQIISLFLLLLLTSCQTPKEEKNEQDYSYLDKPYQGHYKIGEPYKINNQWYYPNNNMNYTEMGVSSWYGTTFDGNKTANGDKYNKYSLTAAHRTLPLPSMVRVTNLENGHSVIVMINDRGPFTNDKNRIIDVSERAADLLGFKHKGIGKVRLEYLPKQTEELLNKLGLKPSNSPQSTEVKTEYSKKKDDEPKKQDIEIQVTAKDKVYSECDSKDEYFIQIAAYKNKLTANKMVTKLKNIANAKVTKISKKGLDLYRVRLGPFKNLKDAQETLEQLKEIDNIKPIIAQN